MKRAFCYLTGTGNSLYAGQCMAKELKGDNVFMSIPDIIEKAEILKDYDQIGIFFPVYAFSPPEIVLDFIDALPSSVVNKYVFAVATCGAFAGDALLEIEKQLEENGFSLNFGASVVMPDNYTTMLKAPSETAQNRILDNSEKRIKIIARSILAQKNEAIPKGTFGLMKPINKAFMSDGNNRDRKFFITKSCISCGECVDICPVHNITMVDGKPKFNGNCIFCLGCFNRCPKGAINYGRATIKKPRYVNKRVDFNI